MNKYLCPVVLSLLLVGCNNPGDDVVSYVAGIKNSAKGKVEPLPLEEELKIAEYTGGNKRSPFAMQNDMQVVTLELSDDVEQKPRPDIDRPREFLERYPLDDFTMVGTMSKRERVWALLQTSDGLVHAVKVGDYLGHNSGKVISIGGNRIALQEMVPDGKGGWRAQNTLLTITQSAGDNNDS